jgi:H+/Cl- antiporter ClcA
MELAPEYLPKTRYCQVCAFGAMAMLSLALSQGLLGHGKAVYIPAKYSEFVAAALFALGASLCGRFYHRQALVAHRMKSKPWLNRYSHHPRLEPKSEPLAETVS